MHIPRIWVKADAEVSTPDRGVLPLVAWGWGSDTAEARREAEGKLERLTGRVRRGEPFPDAYAYGSRPIREEILQAIGGQDDPRAVLTRNRYGATVLNAARLLFLDIDLPEGAGAGTGFLGKLFGGKGADAAALDKLRDTLAASGKGAFRIYRTAGGFRALATDREFDPAARESQDLMKATGTDPWFVRLCLAQKSFRARLTPKPWRIGLKPPPEGYPRDDRAAEQRFAEWLAEYEQASRPHATCRYLETVGKGGMVGSGNEDLVALHDRMTRASEALPLA
jgi:hypothetical protein